ncbi:MAG TPA: dihydroorotase [Terriglobia bacterium]|nr:dihydroorotase [Terriglobia bacterium]
MSSLLIQGGRVVAPLDGFDAGLDVLVEDGVIRQVAPGLRGPADEVIDAGGQVVAPGLIDLHVHLREPGGEASETLETGLAAAVAGGFTSVCPMPNTSPVNDHVDFTRALIERAKRLGLARVFPIAAVSMRSEGETLTDFRGLVAAGAVAFSDDGRPVKTAALMRRALEAARDVGVAVIEHCEDPSLSAGAVVNEGAVAQKLGVKGACGASEEVCLARDVVLAADTGGHLHAAHISTARSVELVRAARRRGIRVTAEATPHHFTLTDEAVQRCGTAAKMNPPLRSARDLEAVLGGLADGAIDAIATDHAPHAPELKAKPLAEAPFGVIGLETALGLALTFLVHTGRITLAQLVTLLSANPAQMIHQTLGRLAVGAAADLTVFNPDLEWTYRAEDGRSKSRNSPFDGWKLKGAVTATVVAGRVVYRRSN